jgi:hypothetical protein
MICLEQMVFNVIKFGEDHRSIPEFFVIRFVYLEKLSLSYATQPICQPICSNKMIDCLTSDILLLLLLFFFFTKFETFSRTTQIF